MRKEIELTRKRARPMRRAIALLSAGLMIAAGLVAVTPSVPASAADPSGFNAGNIISDGNFYDDDAMSEAEIQAFLDAKIGTCNNSLCLNILTQNTYDRPADRTVCAAYTGADNELASRLIYKVQKACGISAKVLLVTLQKEMGLITNKAPRQGQLNAAMGYGCPDTSPCDSDQAGFYNQIYRAAWQFKRYSTPDQWGYYQPGVKTIKYHPNSSCGSSSVLIQNNATAALYNYTPYQPTAGAIAAYPSVSPPCGSYGNRNFWFYYSDWFGSPTDISPVGVTVDRIGGTNRYDTAVQISEQAFPDPEASPVPVVYVTDGSNFPDALSAAPVAARDKGPLLLVKKEYVPGIVLSEIVRLAPAKIVVTGLAGAVSDDVFNELAEIAPTERVGGLNRYETSRRIASTFAMGTTTTAFVSTGSMFPDALSASAAAGSLGAPVILVPGQSTELDTETSDLLQNLGVTTVFITGGPAAVSTELEASLALVPGVTEVTRYGGSNRYIVSAATTRASFASSDEIYIASGMSFPDALAGAAVAGMNKIPLYLTPSSCVYRSVIEDFDTFGATKMTILGGTGVLGSGVSSFVNCY